MCVYIYNAPHTISCTLSHDVSTIESGYCGKRMCPSELASDNIHFLFNFFLYFDDKTHVQTENERPAIRLGERRRKLKPDRTLETRRYLHHSIYFALTHRFALTDWLRASQFAFYCYFKFIICLFSVGFYFWCCCLVFFFFIFSASVQRSQSVQWFEDVCVDVVDRRCNHLLFACAVCASRYFSSFFIIVWTTLCLCVFVRLFAIECISHSHATARWPCAHCERGSDPTKRLACTRQKRLDLMK